MFYNYDIHETLPNHITEILIMKIEAHYCHKDYNAFEEIKSKRGQVPYEITVEVPDTLSDEEIRKEASKSSALKDGYNLKDLYKVEWNGVCWERNKI